MASLALGVRFNPVSSGTVDFVYSSAVTGYRDPVAGLVNSKTYRYRAESADLSQWEFGTGIWSSSTNTLSRNTVDFSSTGSKVSFTLAPQVAITIEPADVLAFDDAMSLTTTQKAQAKTNLRVSNPTIQVLNSGTAATYTTPANCTWIRVRMVGGGGGGSGSGSVVGTPGGTGGNTTFGLHTANGSSGGVLCDTSGNGGNPGGTIGAGGVGKLFVGSAGGASNSQVIANNPMGGAQGGSSMLGGGASSVVYSTAGSAAAANTGGGGGGAGNGNVSGGTYNGTGGGGGGGIDIIIASPVATYTYTIGAGGSGGTGSGILNGGAGGSGCIIVEEHYD